MDDQRPESSNRNTDLICQRGSIQLLGTSLAANAFAMQGLTDILFKDAHRIRIDPHYARPHYATSLIESDPDTLQLLVRSGRDEFESALSKSLIHYGSPRSSIHDRKDTPHECHWTQSRLFGLRRGCAAWSLLCAHAIPAAAYSWAKGVEFVVGLLWTRFGRLPRP